METISYFIISIIKNSIYKSVAFDIYVTAGMDISAGSVLPGPNLTGGMEQGMNTNI